MLGTQCRREMKNGGGINPPVALVSVSTVGKAGGSDVTSHVP